MPPYTPNERKKVLWGLFRNGYNFNEDLDKIRAPEDIPALFQHLDFEGEDAAEVEAFAKFPLSRHQEIRGQPTSFFTPAEFSALTEIADIFIPQDYKVCIVITGTTAERYDYIKSLNLFRKVY